MTTCFTIVSMVLDEATKHFSNEGFYENAFEKHALRESCTAVDSFVEEYGALACEAWVNKETTDIIISLVCDSLELFGSQNSFFELMGRAKEFSFTPHDRDNVRLTFTFNGIWSSAS